MADANFHDLNRPVDKQSTRPLGHAKAVERICREEVGFGQLDVPRALKRYAELTQRQPAAGIAKAIRTRIRQLLHRERRGLLLRRGS